MKSFFILIVAMALASGCQRVESPQTAAGEAPAPKPRTAAGVIVEDLVGNTDIKAGRRARSTLERVGAQERADYEEVTK